nr:integrase, catalytic region, zinc finger, CCHC-type, peptidase aspartic, catalytic [Tanacetum cinerariifolium]
NVKREVEEIETLNIELDHKVTKLVAENEHLKQKYKQLYDSIKSSRVLSKEQCDDLINKVNLKSAEVSDLNASLQEKVFVIPALKEQLNKLKGKAVIIEAVSLNPIDPELLKVDVAPLALKLRKNRTVHTDYIRHTQEEAATLREIVKSKKLLNPLNTSLDYALPPREPIPIVNSTDKPVVTLVYSRKTKAANKKVPGSNSTITKSLVVQIVLWYLVPGCSKHMTGDRSQLVNFVQKFLATVKFGNDHVAKIMGYGDYQIGNVTISRVYYAEGLGNNLFSVGQFCDSDLEVAFRQHTCFIRNLDGVHLLTALSVEILNVVVHDNVKSACLNVDVCVHCVTIQSELKNDFIKKECYETLLQKYNTLEKHCISLEVNNQLKKEISQKNTLFSSESAPTFAELFEINDLKAQAQAKDTVILKLKEKLHSLNGDVNERNVKREVEKIETLNIELDHKVTKLVAENEHLKQTYKQLYDSIKSSRVLSKEQCDDLINKVNLKSAEVSDLNASLQEKVLVIPALKEQLNKLKGKAVIIEVVSLKLIDPELLKVDVAPLAPKLRKNRTVHTDYISHTQEEAATLREIIKRVTLVFSASRSMSQDNTKKNKIWRTQRKAKKNKLEDHLRSIKSSLNKKSVVDLKATSSVTNSVSNVNSNLKCASCNVKRKVWQSTGNMFKTVGHIWKPTGRIFTLVGNVCPLTRIATTTIVPPREPIPIVNSTDKPVVTLDRGSTAEDCTKEKQTANAYFSTWWFWTMATIIEQQVAMYEALVLSTQTLRIERSNLRLSLNIQSKESTLQLVYDVLRRCPFFKADDPIFSMIKVVSRHQNTQQYGAMLPIELTNDEIRNTKAYKEYYAFATREAVPKLKASAIRKRSDYNTSITPLTATLTPKTTVAITPRLTAAAKGKQTAKSVDDQVKDEDDDEGDEGDEGEEDADEDKDGDERDDDDEENQETVKYNEQDDAEGGGNYEEESKSDEEDDNEEIKEEENFDPIPRTPK